MAEETTGVRITQQAIYAKQLEHGETLVKILEKLDHLDAVSYTHLRAHETLS
jgi:hypothetical protein